MRNRSVAHCLPREPGGPRPGRAAADGDASAHGTDPLDLGDLKGNLGDQVYAVPAGIDLTPYRSVVIWCERFRVAFGAAPLDPA